MEKFKETIFNIITKLEYVDYALCLVLWVVGGVLTITGMPWLTISIFLLHLYETITIGVKVGKQANLNFFYSVVMCMTYGFTWWVPVKVKNNLV